MSSIVVSGDTSGSVTLSAPAVAGATVLTLPSVSGTVLTTATPGVPIGGPAFRANAPTTLSITTATFTKVVLNTEDFDTNNCFDSVTNYRFTPTVAGYYQVNASIKFSGSIARALVSIYKNGAQYTRQTDIQGFTSTNLYYCVADLIYMNGSTDYLELWGYAIGTSLTFIAPASNELTNMSAFLVRSAT
jgi:hypothetical protein